MRKPSDGGLTFPYGATSAPYSPSNPHAGADYGGGCGSNVYAPHGGKVTAAGNMGTCGLGIDIDGGKFKSRLCHGSQLLVGVGNQVSEGQVVAKMGATGQASGCHVHWVLWDNGNRVNGNNYLSVSTQGEEMIPNNDFLNALFRAFRGRNAVQAELKYIGTPYNDLVPALDSGPEREGVAKALAVGTVAVKDKWDQQIYGLQAEVKKLQAGQSVTQPEIDNLAKMADELEQAIKAANK